MIDFQSEEFSPLGGITAEGTRRTLGLATLNPLTVLVRESVQNCWDARIDDTSVEVTFDLRTLSSDQRYRFQDIARADRDDRTGLGTLARLNPELTVLTISDRGTTGLGGALRANELAPGRNDFVHFMRNIGEPPDRSHGGGTYGFGKAALYRASAVSAILVHTRTRTESGLESRFMGAALGHNYQVGVRRFTGRHWWGRIAADGVVDPLLGDEADTLADALGLPGFAESQTGTSITIVQPLLHERTPEQHLRFIRTALLWNFWPKMVPYQIGSRPPMRFRLVLDGDELTPPDPDRFPPLDGFAQALRDLRDPAFEPDGMQSRIIEIESLRPARHLGRLSLRHRVQQRGERIRDDIGERDDPIQGDRASAHVALLRSPELVVQYLPHPAPPGNEMVELVGVFRVDDEIDGVFADAEPPTHDRWEPQGLEDRHHQTYVRVAYRRIAQAMSDFTARPDPRSPEVSGLSLAGLAGRLGELLPGTDGTGGGRASRSSRGVVVIDEPELTPRIEDVAVPAATTGNDGGAAGGSADGTAGTGGTPATESRRDGPARHRARVEIDAAAELVIDGGRRALQVPIRIQHALDSDGTVVEAEPSVLLETGEREREAPEGAERPEVIAWVLPDGERLPGSLSRTFDRSVEHARVLVSVPADTQVDLQIRVGREA